jgi:tRNA (cmo5U34)-methyltransferase
VGELTEGTAADFFSDRVSEYDSLIQRAAPKYDEMLDEVVRSLPDAVNDILELGCGTGALTLRIAQRYPKAKLTVVDAVPEMIKVAAERLRGAEPGSCARTQMVVSRFEDMRLEEATYDCITSSMSLHHVVDKEPLYRHLRGAMRPGGWFVFADELYCNIESIQQRFWQRWLDYAGVPGHLSDREIKDIVEHTEAYDRYETLPQQMELLTGAGFREVDCVWRYINYSVFVAR